MNNYSPDFAAVESCLEKIKHLLVDTRRLRFEPEYEDKMYEYGGICVATLDPHSPASKLVVAKTISLRTPSEERPGIVVGNVLIDAERRVMLADFSPSKALEDVPQEGLKGTARYYSPGFIKGTETKYALPSDVWAFSCLLLEVLADRIPYAEKKTQV
ncbi:hypothetical protein FRC01_002406 [Tulasnella sp. 417]|nr:hypothetical protein FRC01_002406 [Tulasnella sp. 417]